MTIDITTDGITIIAADNNKWLHKIDTDIYSNKIYLGKNDKVENWEEVTEKPEPEPEPTIEEQLEDAKDALNILGVN